MVRADPTGLDERISAGSMAVRHLQARLASRRARLPLRYWRQQAHFTTPAAVEAMGRKALAEGTGPVGRALARLDLAPRHLADRLGVDEALIEEMIATPRPAPLVMLDGEDAQALREDVSAQGLAAAASLLRDRSLGSRSLRFFRPPGFNLGESARDLLTVLSSVGRSQEFGLDGIVFPKVEHPEEVALLFRLLDAAEDAADVTRGRIRVALLVESGWGTAHLAEIAETAASRLCALIFGLADYSADLGLPEISNDHALAAWARAEIVNVAGAVGVPAIDGMTLAYPVPDPDLDASANRERFLDRMALVYGDAEDARHMGMLGKWVGHPAQLLAVLLAFEAGFDTHTLDAHANHLETYQRLVTEEARGAAMIGGVMADRATDRHARTVLRQAVAAGRFSPERAQDLRVIEPDELAEARELADLSAQPMPPAPA